MYVIKVDCENVIAREFLKMDPGFVFYCLIAE